MPTLYVTAPPASAPDLARTLVEERLAACVNRVPCQSTYRWNGEILEDDAEEVLFVKTSEETVAATEERIADLHPYDTPCIERFEADAVAAPFAEWIEASTGSEER